MITLTLIGIGTGDPDHLTRAAVRALNAADLILLPRKGGEGDTGKADLAHVRRAILAEVLTAPGPRVAEFDMPRRAAEGDYRAAVDDWHDAIAAAWVQTIAAHLPQGGDVALMVWGDPSLYDSSLRIAARLGARTRVLPGITSLQALTAAHGIALNTLADPVTITTGRLLREGGWPAGAITLAVMLDAGGAYEVLAPQGLHIWWGAYVGLPQQALIAGPLAATAPQITTERARLRGEHGWIMDIYLLRREHRHD